MQNLLGQARMRQAEIVALLRELVECESPTDDKAAVTRFMELVADRLAGEAKIKKVAAGEFGPILQCEFHLPGKKKSLPRIMGLGHGDTVWPVGTLASMPFAEERGRLHGPGIFDMKAGIAFFIFATRLLRELDRPLARRVTMQLTPDEEVGSLASRPITEKEALKCRAVLVLEPAIGPTGLLKTARKGVGDFTVRVKGVAAHAGVDPAAGANAIVELARQTERIAALNGMCPGMTVSPGVVRGGTRANVVPDEAVLEVDVRVTRMRDIGDIEQKLRSLASFNPRCSVEVTGGINRPPMERTKGVQQLFHIAQRIAEDMGVELGEGSSGGGSDGNFTAGLGVATLDGLGAVGDGMHAAHEHILVDRIADRTALLAGLVEALAAPGAK